MRGWDPNHISSARTINYSTFNDARRALIARAAGGQPLNMSDQALLEEAQNQSAARQKNLQNEYMAQYLLALGTQVSGRGINKSVQSPAELMNLRPQNPEFFGLERKDAVPYYKAISDSSNLKAVMKGFQEARDLNGMLPSDSANVIANATRRSTLIAEAFNKPKHESLYEGVSRDPAVNLYQIKLRNIRRDSIYAFQ